ncbi:hypothetical protein ACIQM4_33660 [Streptomyces sp. NPDC091272]|uniref:hypothetical protein n=1 Tax=Streptomyces sp. NPDC091272 TaxID=3365981 RepID=UPI00381C9DF1
MRERVTAVGTAALLAAVAMGVAGCGSPQGPPKEASGSLEELAAKAGCVPEIGTEAAEIRQANCRTANGSYVLATFATDRGRQEWLDGADDYGGSYLLGRRWVVTGDETVVAELRGRLGGTVTSGVRHPGGGQGHPGGHGS